MPAKDDDELVKVACFEPSAGCLCNRAECGGVKELLADCPVHGMSGPEVLRLHDCNPATTRKRARMMASRRASGS